MANEKRLIDANALRTQFDDIPPYIGLAGSLVQQYIDKATTVDAVEVVRCENCVHSPDDGWICGGPNFTMPSHPTYPDAFCSYGERRTDG